MAGSAAAAGLTLVPRGVRPLARAGAFVAGADDVHALTYNPAGLAAARASVLIDASVASVEAQWTPQGLGASSRAEVGRSMRMPIPTLGVVGPRWQPASWLHVRAAAAYGAEVSSLQRWPMDDGSLARYAASDFSGSTLSRALAGVGVGIGSWLQLGGALQLLTGALHSQSCISACEGVSCVHPLDPAYDARVALRSSPVLVPGWTAGVIVRARPWLRLGASLESGFDLDVPVRLQAELPTAALFGHARLQPQQPLGRLAMRLPPSARLGAEFSVASCLRVELAGGWEGWRVHDLLRVTPGPARLEGVVGIDEVVVSDLDIPRHFVDAWSVRLGGEWRPRVGPAGQGGDDRPIVLAAGLMWESSAVPPAMLSPMTVDLGKMVATVGVGLAVSRRVRVDMTWAHLFARRRQVSDSQVRQISAVSPPGPTAVVGNGSYRVAGDVVGVGVAVAL